MKGDRRRASEERFRERYATAGTEAASIIERQVIGGDFGANGYTTLKQAVLLGERLELRPGKLLLDVGCGRGWPGLYLAQATGCRAVLTDLPVPALRSALSRRDESHGTTVDVVRASGAALPLARRSFDAICHTDTL